MLLYVNRYKWVVDWIFVIVRAIPLYTTFYIVSIHLMLLFIRFQRWFNCPGIVSIHLMLLFIAVLKEDFEQYFAFQYISCYSLSFPDRESTIMCLCFNTSHITLYLSEITLFSKSLARFNTSHVTLYREITGKASFSHRSFNTSHVTLYPEGSRRQRRKM